LGAATADADILAALGARGHPLPSLSERNIRTLPRPLGEDLARFTALRRLQLTLGERFAQHIGADGRIHSHFVQIGARSGRMACTRPNLQAISADPGRRRCFAAPPGHVLVMGDYAACELRILADMSQDPALTSAIARGTDLHAAIAQTMFNTEVSRSVRPELRQMAKTIAFGLIYGMGSQALGAALNRAPQDAAALMDRFFATFPKVRDFLTTTSAEAVHRGEARTLSGRRLLLPGQHYDKSTLLRMARNLPIQGTSADLIKVALAGVQRALANVPGGTLAHCIHDEIIVLCPQTRQQDTCRLLQAAMVGAGAGLLRHVPLVAQIRAQADWQAH
jgi:DNA polymerase-1